MLLTGLAIAQTIKIRTVTRRMQAWAMTFVTRTISALRAIFLPLRLAKNLPHPIPMRSTGSIDVKFSAASKERARGVSCKSSRTSLSRCVIALVATISLAHAVDSDADGLDDSVETNTGVYVSASNTGTDPLNPDSDGDFLDDWVEITFSKNPCVRELFPSHVTSEEVIANEPGAEIEGNGTTIFASNKTRADSWFFVTFSGESAMCLNLKTRA